VRHSTFGYLQSIGRAFPLPFYVGLIALITLILTGSLLEKAYSGGSPDWLLALIGIFLMLATSQLAVDLVNWLATLLMSARQLPRMDYSKGIPPESHRP
jgi:hypothetical protein